MRKSNEFQYKNIKKGVNPHENKAEMVTHSFFNDGQNALMVRMKSKVLHAMQDMMLPVLFCFLKMQNQKFSLFFNELFKQISLKLENHYKPLIKDDSTRNDHFIGIIEEYFIELYPKYQKDCSMKEILEFFWNNAFNIQSQTLIDGEYPLFDFKDGSYGKFELKFTANEIYQLVSKYGLPSLHGGDYSSSERATFYNKFIDLEIRFEEISALAHYNRIQDQLFSTLRQIGVNPQIDTNILFFEFSGPKCPSYYTDTKNIYQIEIEKGLDDANNKIVMSMIIISLLSGWKIECFKPSGSTKVKIGEFSRGGSILSGPNEFTARMFKSFLEAIYSETNLVRSVIAANRYNQLRIPHSDPVLYVNYLMRNPTKANLKSIYLHVDFKTLNDLILRSGNEQQVEAWKKFIDEIKKQGDYQGLEYIKIKNEVELKFFINAIITSSTPYTGSYISPDQYTVINGFEYALRLYRYRFKSIL